MNHIHLKMSIFLLTVKIPGFETKFIFLEHRPDAPIKSVWLFFTFTIIFYFSLVSGENMFYANIFSFAHCSYLAVSAVEATLLNSIFWAGFGIGRFLGLAGKFLSQI